VRFQQLTMALSVLGVGLSLACNSIHVQPGSTAVDIVRVEPRPAEYHLRAGDRLALMYMISLNRDIIEEYRLEIGDEIRLVVQDRDDLTGQYLVVPDGWIHLPMLEPIRVRGNSLAEVKKAVTEAYGGVIPNAEVTLSLTRFNTRVNGFIASLAQGIQGPVFETLIELDGVAILPQLGPVPIAGMTLTQINEDLSRRYHDVLTGVDVIVRLASTRGRVVTVLGEVKHPGAFEVPGWITLTEALGLAEGWVPSAQMSSVMVVQPRGDQIYVNKYDLSRQILLATQVQLAAGDMVWVPRSNIANVNLWVEQFVRRNLPINIGVGIPVN